MSESNRSKDAIGVEAREAQAVAAGDHAGHEAHAHGAGAACCGHDHDHARAPADARAAAAPGQAIQWTRRDPAGQAELALAAAPERADACCPGEAHSHEHDHAHAGHDDAGHDHAAHGSHGHAVDDHAGHDHSNHDHAGHGRAAHNHADHDHDHDHAANSHDHGADCCAPAALTLAPLPGTERLADGQERSAFRIMQMDCPTEETLIRKKLGGMASVATLEFNLMQRMLTVVHTPGAADSVAAAIRTLGMTPELAGAADAKAGGAIAEPAKPVWPLVAAGVAALASEAVTWAGLPTWAAALLALASVAVCGLTTYRKGWIAIRNGNLNINALMSIAVTGAMLIGQWPEAAMVMVLFTIAELIEAKSLDRARNAIQGLMRLAPDTATVRQPDGSWASVAAAEVALGAIVRVRPGERIGLDGELVEGRSSVNQAPITGESLPIEKAPGDAVFAGTINESGSFDYRVTAVASNTTLARIIHAVEEAQGAKAPTQRFVDRFARVYTPIVFAIALLVAVVPPLLLGGSWHDWVYRALVLLVIACPCALVISTPVTIVSGLAAAARRGILVKGGVYLEEGRKLGWLALDKTGTLTHGKPVRTDVEALADDLEPQRIAFMAASLASRSDHPVSQAIATAALAERGSAGAPFAEVEGFEALPGRGVRGSIDGAAYWLGNRRLAVELGRASAALDERVAALESKGRTVVMLIDATRVLGLFAVADTVKQTSREAIEQLHALGIRTAMLTGDNAHTAAAIAREVGIDDARGNQLPEDKLAAVVELSGQGRAVGMVGDGINDAPALARADIGFAMGAMGTDTAIETADVALMDDDLRKIPAFVRLSRATHRVLVQNIGFALVVKAVFLGLTVAGLGTMWMAVFADAGASLIVVGNGLRLLRASR
ncbi:heavy metal translocating P-type ATPase [Burkholderia gladioli]|uniref:heavy metal translocating P-type ATPase n=1 Tax=Burkholderia gladioli TaxID=28095 RepID=UPI00163FBE3F|nr:heavy metal translocating P-type ATPase [Burkholderia gladioli]